MLNSWDVVYTQGMQAPVLFMYHRVILTFCQMQDQSELKAWRQIMLQGGYGPWTVISEEWKGKKWKPPIQLLG